MWYSILIVVDGWSTCILLFIFLIIPLREFMVSKLMLMKNPSASTQGGGGLIGKEPIIVITYLYSGDGYTYIII